MKVEIFVKLNSMDDVKEFNKICCNFISDIDVKPVNTRFLVDGKSILGLFSLNLSKTLSVTINAVTDMEARRFGYEFEKFMIKAE